MSLAQRVERAHPIDADKRPQILPARIAQPVDLLDITRRPVAVAATVAAAPPPIVDLTPAAELPVPNVPGPRESEVAFELLNEVAKALPNLIARCEHLQTEMATTQATAKVEIDAANELAREWQQIAAALKLQVDGLERGLKVMRQRAEAAEGRVASLRDETEKSQHAAAEAECLSSLFQEKVIASFGARSPMHSVLEALRAKSDRPAA